jgi:FMN phosphatase YigB (HAD superfamily)
MPLSALSEEIGAKAVRLISTDLFDTVLLRDRTIETDRLALACRRAAPRVGVAPEVLIRLRWAFQDSAYRAIAMEQWRGDAALMSVCHGMAAVLGLTDAAARILRDAEIEIEIEHLSPNRPLLTVLRRAARSGIRVIAVSDTYYAAPELHRILDAVADPSPISTVYASADLGLTKHAGDIFAEVERRENSGSAHILHIGDSLRSDVENARAAGWSALHLPRGRLSRLSRFAGRSLSIPIEIRRRLQ